ncbi:hypothetical protein LCGC14_1245690 [marine sediment metagenome]|uniref:Uncharacterized protein n=1 Tax=marine sediment metagenome TaxID=412755 RepID=A0A0F9P8H5_9ZZZZ
MATETGRIHSYPGARAKEMVDDAVRKFRHAHDLTRCTEHANAVLNDAVVALPPGTMTAYIERTEEIIKAG